ncbi:hypothetical protein [Chitinimonas naiadis]
MKLGDALLNALADLLAQQAERRHKGSRMTVIVSDNLAALSTLPWQSDLQRKEEREAYALACFEQQNLTVDSNWVMQADFRHHGAVGLAYALPRDWLIRLVDLLSAHDLKLLEVLPVTAAAYYRHKAVRKGGSTLLLREATRTTALHYSGATLREVDVEPVTGGSQDPGRRLLTRRCAEIDDIDTVFEWSPEPSDHAKLASYVTAMLPTAQHVRIAREAWR